MASSRDYYVLRIEYLTKTETSSKDLFERRKRTRNA